MSSLNLTPNEFVGYRIKPDFYSFNVVIVKRHGAGSKSCGLEYEKPVAYCKSIASAVEWIVSHATRDMAEKDQAEKAVLTGIIADSNSLRDAMVYATAEALKAVAQLELRIIGLGLSQKNLVQALGAPVEMEDSLDVQQEVVK
ncbi:MAG: hypothetical protein Q7S87_00965 [Agitococcus sp.]|nr:hypothetical protein [Agitococcus sp.]MDO9179098.1 hypothetical protein [Agitococcus sp.]